MAKKSKQKGSRFELLVAKKIVSAAGEGYGRKDCYRTPQSGGHEHAGASDLVISPLLDRIYHFCTECKHHKAWRLHHTCEMTVEFQAWHHQVLAACAREGAWRPPLLVIQQQNGPIYAAAPRGAFRSAYEAYADAFSCWTVSYFIKEIGWWEMIPFESLLKMVSMQAEDQRVKRMAAVA